MHSTTATDITVMGDPHVTSEMSGFVDPKEKETGISASPDRLIHVEGGYSFLHTQKVKGICFLLQRLEVVRFTSESALASGNLSVVCRPLPHWFVPRHGLSSEYQKEKHLQLLLDKILSEFYGDMMFFRPCPITPRHGFVDSIAVNANNTEKLRALFWNTWGEDPKGEVAISRFCDATHSMVWTPGSITVGAGHDGATAGRKTVSLPLNNSRLLTALDVEEDVDLTSAGIDASQHPYLEAVCNNTEFQIDVGTKKPAANIFLTQLRAGPKTASSHSDYIPKDVVVHRVIPTEGDLLAWESAVKLMDPSFDVVWHQNGSLTSHYAVHCLMRGVSVFTGDLAPVVGKAYKGNQGEVEVFDYKLALAGIAVGTAYELDFDTESRASTRETLGLMALGLMTLHNAPVMRGKASFWLGVGLGLFWKFSIAACLGEARHAHMVGDNAGVKKKKVKLPRRQIWASAFSQPFQSRRRLTEVAGLFLDSSAWGGSCSFGGEAWYACACAAIVLDNTITRFYKNPTEELFTEVVSAMNRAVNAAHNNGAMFTKFAPNSLFNAAEKNHHTVALVAAPSLLSLREYMENNTVRCMEMYGQWSRCKTLKVKEQAVKEIPFFRPLYVTVKFTKGVDARTRAVFRLVGVNPREATKEARVLSCAFLLSKEEQVVMKQFVITTGHELEVWPDTSSYDKNDTITHVFRVWGVNYELEFTKSEVNFLAPTEHEKSKVPK